MYKDILRAIVGIEIFPVLSLVIFLLVFLVMLAWVLGMDRRRLAEYAHLPLHDGEDGRAERRAAGDASGRRA
jgi:cytochrome c oxidase cbb3-type subunit 4